MEIIGDNIIRHFTTRKIGEGATDADATPTGTVYKNGTATGITVTVTKISTGNYKASFTATAGAGADQFAIGDDWALEIEATVDTVVDVGIIAQGTFDNKRVGALQDIAAGAEMALTENAINAIWAKECDGVTALKCLQEVKAWLCNDSTKAGDSYTPLDHEGNPLFTLTISEAGKVRS